MDIEANTNSEITYNANLTIKSEEDLLVTNEVTGERNYAPCNDKDIDSFSKATHYLRDDLQHAIVSLKWCIEKHSNVSRFFNIYQNLAELTADYLQQIHQLHRKIYISLYGAYDDKAMNVYNKELEQELKNFLKYPIHKQPEDFPFPPASTDLPCFSQEIHALCDFSEPMQGYKNFEEFVGFYKNFIITGLKFSMEKTLHNLQAIDKDILALYQTRIYRSKEEQLIIYRYIQKEYDEKNHDENISKFIKKLKEYFDDFQMDVNLDSLRKCLDKTNQSYENYRECNIWKDNRGQEDEEMEALAYELSRLQTEKSDFERLFKYQEEYNWLTEKIKERKDLELHGDSFFAEWVDPYKLEEYLKFWIKAEINTQEKWYIVWCLMNYSFNMVKEGQSVKDFGNKMDFMFEKVEGVCKCKYESIRKPSNSHSMEFSKWPKDDKDYPIAERLYEKLKQRNRYKKDLFI